MGSPTENKKQELPKIEKLSFFQNYKEKLISKKNKEIENLYEMSGSKIMVDRWFMTFLDVISWIIIAIFVYVWWTTRAQNLILSCDKISVDLCNSCYGIKQLINTNLSNIIQIPKLIP